MNILRLPSVEESYSTPRRCARSRRECPAARRLRLWTTGQNVRCTAAKQLDLPANGTDLPFKYAVLEVQPIKKLNSVHGSILFRRRRPKSVLDLVCLEQAVG